MSEIKRILVAVRDPASLAQPAILKAAQLARRMQAQLEIFHAQFEPFSRTQPLGSGRQMQSDIDDLVNASRTRLHKTVQRLACSDVPMQVSVSWDYPSHDAIVRHARLCKADMVVAESRRHRRPSRLFLSNTDWQLIRHCPVPLILIKSARPWTRAKVLAAVDPLHTRAKPAALDKRILTTATRLARTLGSQLHVAHVYAPLLGYSPGIMTEPLPYRVTGGAARSYVKGVRAKVLAETTRFKISERAVHLAEGEPTRELPRMAKRLKTQLVVMGALSRTGIKRLFIGNTAEKIIDDLTCDVCIVKPPGFRASV